LNKREYNTHVVGEKFFLDRAVFLDATCFGLLKSCKCGVL